ncbi:acetyl-CoA C-acyltransferase [Tsukamurella sp. 8F]|uniref:acetyl-CoA C-acyltransferase n=1 Tax=unclassified Tsukamurella TaxID=2633480 RepID=UPI0023B964A3|nr:MULTISPECIES: acetyl-CoA C-acyltransferase [unclassified Tsukamurella]MDF0528389.1 acetyl-CoA C-acyltransferase [Tsukamurella sp. 8J]MDF0586214.1 acetyl-CoA C-acyltransferase [Tsukamurella sp. 8F]
MSDAVIVDAVRTPVAKGRPGGAYADVHPVDLHAHVLAALVRRTGIDPAVVDDVISGAVGQVGEQSGNTARWAALGAGFPESVPAVTVDRQCGSSQQALHFAAQGVMAGAYDVAIASGAESMSRIPIGSQSLGRDFLGSRVGARYDQGLVPQGISAELIAARWGISRRELDEFSVESHRRAARAWAEGLFDDQISMLNDLAVDETIRPGSDVETLAALRPAFRTEHWADRYPDLDWRVTAGNSSPVNDGAAALLVAGAEAARRLGLRPRARVHSVAVVGDDPVFMLTGIIPATERVLARAGLTIGDIDVFEVNEAFASVVLAWQRETGADLGKVNINGGAIAIGHPLGGSGARLMTTLLSALEQTGGRYGLQVMCEAGGLANATIIERLDQR